MARVTAVSLRNAAREAMLSAGGRGFVRFMDSGALLVSDAVRRCADEAAKQRLMDALHLAGFDCREQDGLLMINPQDELLETITYDGAFSVHWDSRLYAVQALAVRWMKRERQTLTPAGRQLIIDTLRLTWQDRLMDGKMHLCAQAAVMQRSHDTSGLCAAGAVLADWCDRQEGKHHED